MSTSADKQLTEANEFLTTLDITPHVIRSHRRPRNQFARRLTAVVFSLAVATTGIAGVSAVVEKSHGVETAYAAEVPLARQMPHVSRAQRVAKLRQERIDRTIRYALAQRGDRYRFGAAGPNRWDCSGLVMRSVQKGSGIKLPHYTGGIIHKGKKVSRKNLKRGDIIFPQRGHVAIYLGNGKMVAASSGRGRVIVQKVYGFYAARRIV